MNNSRKWSDDAVITGLWKSMLANSGIQNPLNLPPSAQRAALYKQNRDTYISCDSWATYSDDAFRSKKFGGGEPSLGEIACLTGMVFLDASCKLIPLNLLDAKQRGACIVNQLWTRYIGSTPVSLIFDGDGDPMAHYTIVKFPLDPSTGAKYWEWRGSKAAPLLVYDPEHKGEITSAEQVFGVWALGGKPNAEDPQKARSKWAHGFEALGFLDSNKDQQIAEEELAPLGLWFDENEDAVSQAGEVRPVREEGIEALFFEVDNNNDPLGDLTVSIGYHRKIDGKLTTGKAVDWKARGHASAEGLLLGRVLGGERTSDSDGTAEVSAGGALPKGSWNEKTALQSIYTPAGLWRVLLEPENPAEVREKIGETILGFNVSSPDFLEGYSFAEVGIAGMQDAAHAIAFTYNSGHKSLNVDGTIALKFEGTNDFARLENTATLLPDGVTMRGNTVAHLADNKKLRYSWRAVKMFNPSDSRPPE